MYQTIKQSNLMPMKRGTLVVVFNQFNDASGDVGKVSSRKNNGWLRITIERTGKTISVRNGSDVRKWVPNEELKSLSPLQRIEDAATAKLQENSTKYMDLSDKVADEIDSMSDSGDNEFDIVDPPDDAYGDLTTEQQKIIRDLIGQFTKMNRAISNI